MPTRFPHFLFTPMGPARGMRVVTPDDDAELPAAGLPYLPNGGALRFVGDDGVELTVSVPAGTTLNCLAVKVFETGTTADPIYLYAVEAEG